MSNEDKRTMNLYNIQCDEEHYYVEAAGIPEAVFAWKEHIKEERGKDFEGDEEPESVTLVHGEPVIRSTWKKGESNLG